MQICLVVYEILANEDFTVTVVTFVYPTDMQIAFILGFTVQPSL